MTLRLVGHVGLPPHEPGGGFDHAAVHAPTSSLYVAHTSNDAVDVVDIARDDYRSSIPGLRGVAGVLVDDIRDLGFTSNRSEDTVGIFRVGKEVDVVKVPVGHRPNGLAYDPTSRILFVAKVGDPSVPNSTTISFVDVDAGSLLCSLTARGRTRWAIFDPAEKQFWVNIADPPVIVAVDPEDLSRIARKVPVAARGPHGLDLDPKRGRLFCACDAGKLIALDKISGAPIGSVDLSGSPDAIFFNHMNGRLYVAVGTPGVIDVLDGETLTRLNSQRTEKGAHTFALDPKRNRVYAFLPETHRAAVYQDSEGGGN